MWTWWPRQWHRTRPAPPGVGRASNRTDGPPDGWQTLDATRGERASQELDRALLRVADSAAREINRRTFFRRAGEGGLAVGLAMTGLLWNVRQASAYAHIYNTCDPLGDPPPGPCGNSGLCEPSLCTNGNCSNSDRRRDWADVTCDSGTGTSNCWQENCCNNNDWNSHIRCCDCCTRTGQGPICTTCLGGTGRSCNCRKAVGAAC